jgi:thiamine kinase-like enzyme
VASASGESVLLLEDLTPAHTGDWVDGVTLGKAELALRSLARQHAAWWGTDPAEEPELAQLIDNLKEEQDLVERLYAEGWPRFLESDTFEIPDDVRAFGEHLVSRISAAEAMLDHSPRTLVHGDFRLGNLLFGERDGEPTCWVIDWEDITLWNGMFDVAWFLGGCLRVEESGEEKRFLQLYHQALTHEGVKSYSWAQCYQDYRWAMCGAFVQGVLTAVPPETEDGYAHQLARAIGERFIVACQRQRLHELMPLLA